METQTCMINQYNLHNGHTVRTYITPDKSEPIKIKNLLESDY